MPSFWLIDSHPIIFSVQLLLRKKAAEELKKEQERKAAERRRIIEERCGKPKDVENASEGMLLLRHFAFLYQPLLCTLFTRFPFDYDRPWNCYFPRIDNLRQMLNAHHDRINKLEDQKYDLELFVKRKDFEVQKITELLLLSLHCHAPQCKMQEFSQPEIKFFQILRLLF